LADNARREAFTVAGVESEAVLGKVRDALSESVGEGKTLEDFKQRVEENVGEGTFLSDAHAETVFRGAVQSAYSAGQERLLEHPVVDELFPYATIDSVHDSRRRPEHGALETYGLDGTNYYRRDDPVFQLFCPPWDFGCRCGWTAKSVRDAAAAGVREAQRWLETGRPPTFPQHVQPPPFRPPAGFTRGGGATLATAPPEDDGDPSRALAESYADLWNVLEEAGLEVPESELEAAGGELAGGGWVVYHDGLSGWKVIHADEMVGGDDESRTLATAHAPKGGVSVGGKFFAGGRFIPAADVAKATPEQREQIEKGTKAKAATRKARGDVDVGGLRARLAPHAGRELAKHEATSAKLSFAALHRHHGALTLHRVEELVGQAESALAGIPDDHPNAEGLRHQLGQRLKAYHGMLGAAEARGLTGRVPPPENPPNNPSTAVDKPPASGDNNPGGDKPKPPGDKPMNANLPEGVVSRPERVVVEKPGDDVREYTTVVNGRLSLTRDKRREVVTALPRRREVEFHEDTSGNKTPKEWFREHSADLGEGYRLAQRDGHDYLLTPDGKMWWLGYGKVNDAVRPILDAARARLREGK
jgi:hypothetical protein